MSHRLFVAIRPSEDAMDAMFDVMDGIEDARWQDETQLHLTLRYIGEVDTPQANDIADALSRIEAPAFDLELRGLGHFSKSHWPHAVWAGVVHSPELLTLQKKVERAVVAAGCEAETRRFLPHVTLARLNRSSGPIGDWLARFGDFHVGPMHVDSYLLYESTLTPSGSQYDPVVRFALSGKANLK